MRRSIKYSRLSAKVGIRQIEGHGHAEGLADLVDTVMGRWWRNLIRFLRANPGGHHFHWAFHQLPSLLIKDLAQAMARIAHWGHKTAVEPLRHELPKGWIERQASRALSESRLMEDTDRPRLMAPGSDLPEPATRIGKDELWELLKRWLFPPPDGPTLHGIIFGTGWADRIASITALAKPQALAQQLQIGYQQGENIQQLAKRLLPELDGVRSSARRLARTEAIRIAHTVQERAWNQLGPLRIGYQIHSAFSQHTRPWHALRSGTIYYDSPSGNQKGPDQCPHPPQEAADPAERPPNAPKTAYN